MAINTTAGGPVGGVSYPCILYEGALTATAIVHGADGYYDRGVTAAAGLVKDQWVELDAQVDNTFAATGGMPVVKALASNGAAAGFHSMALALSGSGMIRSTRLVRMMRRRAASFGPPSAEWRPLATAAARSTES